MKAEKQIVNERLDKWIQQYVALRDRIKEMEEAFEKSKKPLSAAMQELNGLMQSFLDESGSESIKTQYGTCYSSVRYSASVADGKAFMDYVIGSQSFELLDRRANVTAVKAFVEENKTEPPGCRLTALRTVGVRRGKGDKDE